MLLLLSALAQADPWSDAAGQLAMPLTVDGVTEGSHREQVMMVLEAEEVDMMGDMITSIDYWLEVAADCPPE